ncbi:hypothetical protein [Streptomyces zaomyceticus]|uniref:hypothetical protein n=1 Tax=Streptomyces zaomyceticus TaxID=68286 RepID=UPI0037A71817
MGEITVSADSIDRLLHDPGSTYGTPYQQAYGELARTHRGRPVAEIVPLLRAAADRALLGFSRADLIEQARAISSGARYELRVRVAGREDEIIDLVLDEPAPTGIPDGFDRVDVRDRRIDLALRGHAGQASHAVPTRASRLPVRG